MTIDESALPCRLNLTVAPSERPIQLRCMSLMLSGQSRSSRSSSSLSAYWVMRSIHCRKHRASTLVHRHASRLMLFKLRSQPQPSSMLIHPVERPSLLLRDGT